MMLKSVYFMFFVCMFMLGLMACSSKPKDKFKNLTADEFERLIENSNVQRLDVRTVAEYSEGHIAGSININVFDENFSATVHIPADTRSAFPVISVHSPVSIQYRWQS